MSSVWFIVNCDLCQQETGICKHFRKKRLTCRIPPHCRSIPTALAPFAVVICRMIMQNVVCFSFKGNIQQMICEINIAANSNSRAPRAFFVFEHLPLCTRSFAKYLNNFTAIEGNNTCDFMYKFSLKYFSEGLLLINSSKQQTHKSRFSTEMKQDEHSTAKLTLKRWSNRSPAAEHRWARPKTDHQPCISFMLKHD